MRIPKPINHTISLDPGIHTSALRSLTFHIDSLLACHPSPNQASPTGDSGPDIAENYEANADLKAQLAAALKSCEIELMVARGELTSSQRNQLSKQSRRGLFIDNAPDCVLGESKIHGLGLFAGRIFESGDIVASYSIGIENWQMAQYDSLPPEVLENEWFVGLNKTIAMFSEHYAKTSFINHATSPNCGGSWREMQIVAAKQISPGEEITVDFRSLPRGPIPIPQWMH